MQRKVKLYLIEVGLKKFFITKIIKILQNLDELTFAL